ncbi:hypothetical protein [Hoeflea prorocentri]|uniref:Uncharacterized protein n=1 Tax=Hoeflea prorocentri TaxID=1922333 RepID=A0A9X3UGD9_9HYPH|nr:hypothetical protein [Hoeflea prorocentri]MCY6380303.1 hypothetical protein [Hoeflea prorocentri]MDA5398103.1 hypothetical protein [Hoeflea prorocentri]
MTLLIAKILSTVFLVLGLSAIAERAGPALAGVLAGFPLGVAIVFLFIGIEQGPFFITDAAAYTVGGFAATLCFNLAYWFISSRIQNHVFLGSILGALAVFLLAAWIISQWPLNVWTGTLLVAAVAASSVFVMRGHNETRIASAIRLTWPVIALRAAIAVVVVLAITGAAAAIGPKWSGLLAAFPITLFPVLIIIQFTYSVEDAGTVIQTFPFGLPSLVVFVVCAWATFEPLGVPLGFVTSLMASALWLTGFFVLRKRLKEMGPISR